MKVLRGVFAFYINSSIHVALAIISLMAITVREYNLTIPIELWAFVFLGSLTGYNFVKYAKVAGLHHRSLTNSLKSIQILSAISFALLVIMAFQLSITTLLLAAGFGLATFLYAVPFIRNKNLRRLSGIKIFVVAFVWAGVTVLVPVDASEVSISGDIWLTFFQRILIVIALILPFEIRDVPYDAHTLKTVPHQVGVKTTKLIGQVILIFSLVFEFFKQDCEVAYILSLLFFCVVLGWFIVHSKTEQSRYFASFWVEGLPILWYALFVLFENL